MRSPAPPFTLVGMLLCQAQDPSREIFFWLGAIVVAAIVLGVIAMVLRKLLLGQDEAPAIGFTLADLRELHASGEMTDAEFAQAKGKMLAQNRAMLEEGDPESDAEAQGDSVLGAGPGGPSLGEDSANPVDEPEGPDGSPDKNR